MWRDFNFFRLTDRRLTDRQNRLLNPASHMRAWGNNSCRLVAHAKQSINQSINVKEGVIQRLNNLSGYSPTKKGKKKMNNESTVSTDKNYAYRT